MSALVKYLGEHFLYFYNKVYWFRNKDKLFDFVGLSVSRVCSANCIFCPVTKNNYLHPDAGRRRFIPLEVVERVVGDLEELSFSGTINLGENGDALLNPDFEKIVQIIRERLPSAKLILYTNMANVGWKMSYFLLENNLSELFVNIDGSNREIYEFAKRGLKFDRVKNNLLDFIRIRDELKADCKINITPVSPRRYMELRGERYEDESIYYDVEDIVGFWTPHLLEGDCVKEWIYFFNWNNERAEEVRRKSCPIVEQFFDKLNVSPEGDVYLCCLDALTELTVGNVLEQSVMEIWNGKKRKEIIKNIINKNYNNVGMPCVCCNEKNDFLRCHLNYFKHRLLG